MDGIGQALLVTAALSALGIVVSLAAVLVRAVALQRSIARVATGALSRDAALADARKLARIVVQVVGFMAVFPPLVILVIRSQEGQFVVDPHLGLGIFAVVCSITLFANSVLASALLGPRIGRALRGVTPTIGESAISTFKVGLLNHLPFIVFSIGLSLSFASGWALGVWLSCFAAVVWSAAVLLFSGHVQRSINPTRPADALSHPGLTDRIACWAARCDVSPPNCRVMYTANLGSGYLFEAGVLDRTLVISDNVIASMDWRQQDAFIVRAIEGNKRAPRHARFVIAVMVCIYALIGGLFTLPQLNMTPDTATLLAVVLLLYSPFLYQTRRRADRESILRLDQLAAEVTGDPLAVMVGMKTLAALNGAGGELSNAGPQLAPLGDRMRALDAWMQRPGPRAPWAYQPVPSRWPVTVGAYLLTAPLESAPPPAPVPSAPYATRVPVAP